MNFNTIESILDESGIELYDYQKRYIAADSHRNKSFRGARQVGKTTTALVEAAKRASDDKVTVVFPSHRMKEEAKRKNPFSDYASVFDGKVNYISQHNLTPDSTSLIGTDHVIVDEIDFVDYSRVYDVLVKPNSATQSFYGTPKCRASIFPFAEDSDDWLNLHISMFDCPSIDPDFPKQMKKSLSYDQYRHEVYGEAEREVF